MVAKQQTTLDRDLDPRGQDSKGTVSKDQADAAFADAAAFVSKRAFKMKTGQDTSTRLPIGSKFV